MKGKQGAARSELSKQKSLDSRLPNVYSDQITRHKVGSICKAKKGRTGGSDNNRTHGGKNFERHDEAA